MARIHELLAQLRATSPAVAADIEREVEALADRRAFGLNFERHTPEAVELPGRKVRVGDKVRVQPPRGKLAAAENQSLYMVVTIERNGDGQIATIAPLGAEIKDAGAGDATNTVDVNDLVVVAEFSDPIYPGLVSTGKEERGGDKPYHTVINAENFHALQALLFTHRGKVDAIYIDPPYNSGARDWKYNNDYVESDDLYRHSKWLAFMERRLHLAKALLNPGNSVLIVTIDEKEYLRLGLLLEQTFPEARLQMVSIVMNSQGTPRIDMLSRVDEYAFFVLLGDAKVSWTSDDMLAPVENTDVSPHSPQLWYPLLRSGTDPYREDAPNQFYPIYISKDTLAVHSIGDPLPLGVSRSSVVAPGPGLEIIWPILGNGRESRWQLSRESLVEYVSKGYARAGAIGRTGLRSFTYLRRGTITRIEDGSIRVLGRDDRGALLLEVGDLGKKLRSPKTIWNRGAHEAGEYGSKLLRKLMPDRKFPFPKSLYAVEDTLRFFVADKPEAVIIDFFSGSGTTTHAVMRLNKQDNGRRVSISVTNNEVSADEQKELRNRGLRPGDEEWEQWGICDYITKPRIRAAITGNTPEGVQISGDYKFADEFPMKDGFHENVEFFTLTYEAPMRIQSNREFARIAPFLWLRAGSRGRRIESLETGWDVADAYGVLADLDQTNAFIEAVKERSNVVAAFIVTDEDRLFEAVVRDLPPNVEPVRMYESYLSNFEIDAMRSVR